MSKIVENYLLQEAVGSGQFGKVYRGKHLKTNEQVAIKVVKLGKFKEIPKLEEFTTNEIQTLSKIENPNVIRFIGNFVFFLFKNEINRNVKIFK